MPEEPRWLFSAQPIVRCWSRFCWDCGRFALIFRDAGRSGIRSWTTQWRTSAFRRFPWVSSDGKSEHYRAWFGVGAFQVGLHRAVDPHLVFGPTVEFGDNGGEVSASVDFIFG